MHHQHLQKGCQMVPLQGVNSPFLRVSLAPHIEGAGSHLYIFPIFPNQQIRWLGCCLAGKGGSRGLWGVPTQWCRRASVVAEKMYQSSPGWNLAEPSVIHHLWWRCFFNVFFYINHFAMLEKCIFLLTCEHQLWIMTNQKNTETMRPRLASRSSSAM